MKPVNRKPRPRRQGQGGFTLVELLVVMMLTALTVAAIAAFDNYQLRALRDQADQVDLQSTARAIIDLMGREIRSAGIADVAGVPGHCGIQEATANRLRLVLRDGDGNRQQIEYEVGSNGIRRRQGNDTAEPVIDNVDLEGSRLSYFRYPDPPCTEDCPECHEGCEFPPTTAVERREIRRIRIELSISNGQQRARVASNIDLRNRFFISGMNVPNCT